MEEVIELKEELAALEERYKELMDQLAEGESVREDLSMVVWQKEERIKSLNVAIDNYTEELKEKTELIGKLQMQVTSLQKTINTLQKQLGEIGKVMEQQPVKMGIKVQDTLEKVLSLIKKK